MARYFDISTGLRGCYMPDNAYIIRAETRRDLKAALESEAASVRDAEYVGASKRAVASIAAAAWRQRKETYPMVIPYRQRDQDAYPYGIFVATSNRADYLAQDSEG